MNKLPIAMLVGAMVISTGALADREETETTQAKPKPKSCSELSGKERDKCIQATPAGPVVMTTGKQKKGKSEIAKDRESAKAKSDPASPPLDQSSDVGGQPKQRPPVNEAQAAAATENPPPAKKP